MSELGPFVGGGPINNDYKLQGNLHRLFRSHHQVRGEPRFEVARQSQCSQKLLTDPTLPRFHGKIELTPSELKQDPTSLDLKKYIDLLGRFIAINGLEYHFSFQKGGEMLFLLDHYHEFSLEEMCTRRAIEGD